MARKQHNLTNQLILASKDVSMFPIQRVASGWQVTDKRSDDVRVFRTRYEAELAICSVVRYAMGERI
jgi:hypothetical protein